jgi:hypothetical protein
MEKRSALAVFMLVLSVNLYAQDLHVYYNLYTDSVWYIKNGKPLEKAGVNKRDYIQLHVIEFNDFLYKLKTEQKEIVKNPEDAEKIRNTMDKIVKGAGSVFSGFKLFPIEQILTSYSPDQEIGYTSGICGNYAVKFGLLDKSRQSMEKIEDMIAELADSVSRISSIVVAGTLSPNYIDELLHSADLPPSEIKILVEEQISMIFGPTFMKKPSLHEALEWGKHLQSLRTSIFLLNGLNQQWEEESQKYCKLLENLEIEGQKSPELLDCLFEYHTVEREIAVLDYSIKLLLTNAMSLSEQASRVTPDQLSAFYRNALELRRHRFEYNETVTPVGKEMDIILKFGIKESNDNDKKSEPAVNVIKAIRIQNHDGFKLFTTAGFGFAAFFSPQKMYSIGENSANESIIVETAADQFVPLATTAVQFCNDRGRPVTLGGQLGIAMPLNSSGGQTQSLNFLAGPCLLIGRDQRVSVSLGLMGGKTARLPNDIQPFQQFNTQNGTRPIPLVSRYELGGYFGVTIGL